MALRFGFLHQASKSSAPGPVAKTEQGSVPKLADAAGLLLRFPDGNVTD
jgi:hypothetical protein